MNGESALVLGDASGDQEDALFVVSPTLPERVQADLMPVWTAMGVPPSAFPERLGGFSDPASSPYAKRKGFFDTAARGFGATSDRIWFFRSGTFLRYFERPGRKDEATDLLPIEGNWSGVPDGFTSGIDAVLTGAVAPYRDDVWLFSGNQYLRYNPNSDAVVITARPIAGNWNLPEDFTLGIDAAIHGVGDYAGIAWFFRGGQYVRYNIRTDSLEYGPGEITANWRNWPDAFADGVDFAFYGTGPHAEDIYFVRGDQFIRYSLSADRVEEGPSRVIDAWPALARFAPVPQIFLVEHYALSVLHGDLGHGGIVGVPISVGGRTKTEVYVVTKKSNTIDESTSSNILESSSERVLENFSDSVRTDDSNAESRDNYDYGTNASFHGEAHATGITGGELNVDLTVRGDTQDVRRNFAHAVGHQLDKATQDSHERHVDQVSAHDSSYQIHEEVETGFRQTVDNSANDDPVNFVLYQLTQEYLVVLSLTGARVVFRNGDDRAEMEVAVRDMTSLLESCLDIPEARAAVRRGIVTALTSVTDTTTGEDRSLLKPGTTPDNPDGAAVDQTVHTSLAITVGGTARHLDIAGIVIDVQRPIVLTSNTALAPLHGSD